MEQLIPVINKLQDVFTLFEGGSPIDLPCITCVGSQSSGKRVNSSVLEALVGKDFLPRGSGIVTRRPLILQLNHINPTKSKLSKDNTAETVNWGESGAEWGEFLHLPNQKFYDFKEIREEIQRETDRMTGKNKGISPVPINLKVYSPNVLNLTLVDLPGITRVPIGDQPKDIEQQIRRMVLSYIEKPNTIILAVSAANTDLTNSDALDIARQVDPEGRRTIGVISKLDIMDKGVDALDMLQGKIVPLKLGYIGVVNRSQQDIIDNTPITEAQKKEKDFFTSSPIYSSVAHRCGTKYLGERCAQVLMLHIKNCLPELKTKVNQMILDVSNELKSYGENAYNISPGALLLQILNNFSSSFTEMIEGKVTDDVSVDSLYGGARINFIFNEIYAKHINSLDPTQGLTKQDIKTAMQNATGPKAALFVPESAFELLVRRQLARFKEPALQCVDLIYDELESIVNMINSPELQRFQNLKEELTEAATNLLRKCRTPAKEMITNITHMELTFINTNHPDFKIDTIIQNVMMKRQQQVQMKQQEPQMGSAVTDPLRQAQMNSQQNVKQQQQVKAKQQQSTSPTQPSDASSPTDKSSFFGLWFGGGGPTKGNREPDSRQPRHNDRNLSQPKPVKLEPVPSTLQVNSIPKEKEFEIELLEGLLEAYFNIVRKNFIDSVPKAIMYFLVGKSKEEMQNELVQQLYKEQNFDTLLAENDEIVSQRNRCKKVLELLQKAQSILSEVRDYKLHSNPHPQISSSLMRDFS